MNLPSTPMSAASGWRPVDPPRRPVLFINPKSGGGKAARADLAGRARARDRSRHPGPGAGPDRADPWRGGGPGWWMPILVSATVQLASSTAATSATAAGLGSVRGPQWCRCGPSGWRPGARARRPTCRMTRRRRACACGWLGSARRSRRGTPGLAPWTAPRSGRHGRRRTGVRSPRYARIVLRGLFAFARSVRKSSSGFGVVVGEQVGDLAGGHGAVGEVVAGQVLGVPPGRRKLGS